MNRFFKMVSIVVVALFCLSLAPKAYAHRGRTDSDGGHTNHSTGEYHYHHGYEAHDHYDMDGDGDLDCPFNFKDNTSKNKSTTSESGSGTSSNVSSNTTKTTASQPKKSIIEKAVDFLKICGCVLLFGLMFLGGISQFVTKRRRYGKPAFQREKLLTPDEFLTVFIIVTFSISAIILSILIFHPQYNIIRFFK